MYMQQQQQTATPIQMAVQTSIQVSIGEVGSGVHDCLDLDLDLDLSLELELELELDLGLISRDMPQSEDAIPQPEAVMPQSEDAMFQSEAVMPQSEGVPSGPVLPGHAP